MTQQIKYRYSFFFLCLAIVAFAYPAFSGMHFPTAINVQKSIYFQQPGGQAVQLQPGIYEVAERSEQTIMLSAIGSEQSQSVALQAVSASHVGSVTVDSAEFIPVTG